ncbi:MAG: glycosyltransferase family 1 protein [Planctomycetota bacterium]|nr:MAG: glycosyltransferase family 1 protein [Planctomycetota bacterium]
MKIAFVHQPWDDAVPRQREGSLAIWVHEVSRRLAREHEVHVFGRGPNGAATHTDDAGVAYHGVSLAPDRPILRLLHAWPRRTAARRPAFASPWFHCRYARRIGRLLDELDVDVVHVHNFSNFVPILRSGAPRAKTVLHMHCEWLTQIDRRWIEPRLRQSDAILACSEYVIERVRRAFPDLAGRCATLPNGVDPGRFDCGAPPANSKLVLFVGRVSPEKGLHDLLDAFVIVRRRHPEARLRIVGPQTPAPFEYLAALGDAELTAALAPHYESDYLASLRRRAEPCGDAVEFAGPRPHEELPRHYAEAAVVVNPSLSEAFGMSLIESLAAGRPVVATRVGGMTEIVGDEAVGRLTPAGDPAALAEAICDLLADGDERVRLGRNGVVRSNEQYAWERVVERLSGIYARLV